MTLREYLETNKLNKDIFIALYNKDNIWIICGKQDDNRLDDYMDMNIVVESESTSEFIKKFMLEYDKPLQVAYYRKKEEERSVIVGTTKENKNKAKKRK